jgi:phospholipase C
MRPAVVLVAALVVAACPGAHAAAPVPDFAHVIVVVFENKDESQIIGSDDAPTFNQFAQRYARLSRYTAVTHPSLPNYLALVSGSTHGIHSDCTSCIVNAPNLSDTLRRAGRSWKTYAENLPRPGYTGAFRGRYAKKHNPFLYFRDVVRNPARRNRIVPLTQLALDLHARALPDFSLVVPNMCNSMHDCSVETGDAWLRRLLPPLLELPKTAVFVVFDEGRTRGGNRVPALVLGTAVRPGVQSAQVTGHYGLLRTVEAAWGLPLLGNSARAAPITGIWR